MQEAETQRARAETDRVRDKAQADILAMAMEKASAITSRDAAFAELEKTRSELKEFGSHPDKFTGARSDLRRFATQIRGK
ncbi:hypothetical protein MCOR02_007841 [Pyricularia oryzae]|nr:hypothetical protein MCOR02_007841 [Pyricularia oryzae]